ncbi:polyhydroxyalkanoate synthesis repressor PhaR [Acetobacter orientalis]|uniref:Polyhydroxyalkanoate synthesis repressor PhaR n=1 Tax=Acetobacter orientalis TaxID=146474 RepID=A0A2Z5ZIY2_9PROT|nr:polyhydroxyalkanoate synthesis repressor PhaR [Acetobacter orientalis]
MVPQTPGQPAMRHFKKQPLGRSAWVKLGNARALCARAFLYSF